MWGGPESLLTWAAWFPSGDGRSRSRSRNPDPERLGGEVSAHAPRWAVMVTLAILPWAARLSSRRAGPAAHRQPKARLRRLSCEERTRPGALGSGGSDNATHVGALLKKPVRLEPHAFRHRRTLLPESACAPQGRFGFEPCRADEDSSPLSGKKRIPAAAAAGGRHRRPPCGGAALAIRAEARTRRFSQSIHNPNACGSRLGSSSSPGG